MPSLLQSCCISDPSKCLFSCYMPQVLQAWIPNANATKTVPFHKRKAPLTQCSDLLRNDVFRTDHNAIQHMHNTNSKSPTDFATSCPQNKSLQTIHIEQKRHKHFNPLRRNLYSLSPACGKPAACPSNRYHAKPHPKRAHTNAMCSYNAPTMV